MKKINNSGFVLVETLIVSVVVMVIFSILYSNFYPMIGEYEQRENYDDIDSKYAAYWIKRIVQSEAVDSATIYSILGADTTTAGTANYMQLTYNMVLDERNSLYKELVTAFNINTDSAGKPTVYLTKYNLGTATTGGLKSQAEDFSRGLEAYIKYLPSYTTPSINNAQYRLIIQFHRTKDDNDFYTYSTIEVRK